jgi:hypothetical protein
MIPERTEKLKGPVSEESLSDEVEGSKDIELEEKNDKKEEVGLSNKHVNEETTENTADESKS